MFSKISVRNIPQHIFNALEVLATKHDRSTEAEVRQAIQAWVEPTLIQEERNTRRREVAERLKRALEQVNDYRHDKMRPSHIAQGIGLERAEEVEDWFLGEREPTFRELSQIAELFGIGAPWLIHGDGKMFPVEGYRVPEDPVAAVDWLTTWPDQADTLKTLHLIRSSDESGSLYIVKESEKKRFLMYHTPTHVSESIGAGGEAMLTHLFVTLELLYKRWTKGGAGYHVAGHQIRQDEISLVMKGNKNPGSFLDNNGVSMWWEDIWDRAMVDRNTYWTGWRSLCDRIERAIVATPHLSEIRQKIRSGEIR